MEQILQKALELGKVIAQSEEYKVMRDKEAVMLNDPAAAELIKKFQDLQQTHEMIQMQGNQLTESQINDVYDMEEKMLANPIIKDFTEAQDKFHHVLGEVNEKISEGIEGKPRESCGCSSCGSGSCSC